MAYGIVNVPSSADADTAVRLLTARVISLSGGAVSDGDKFDGTRDLVIRVTQLDPEHLLKPVPVQKGGTGADSPEEALVNLGAASQADLSDLTARVTEAESKLTVLWDAVFTNITGNPFTVVLSSLDGITVTAGVWNAAKSRLEC